MTQQQQSKSKKDDWQTPDRVLEPLWQTTGIDMDPCAGEVTEIGDINVTEDADGLSIPWEGTVYVNPPYSDKKTWIQKCIEESKRQPVDRVYLLTPDSTDVISWWHDKIAEHAEWSVFFESRVKFYDPHEGKVKGSPPNGSALHIFGEVPDVTLRQLAKEGDVVKRPRFL